MIKKTLILILTCFIAACAVKPIPLTIDQRYTQAQADIKELFTPQQSIAKHIDYYEALARSLRFNLDYRIKMVNTALQAGQLKVAEYTMFPALNISGSLYTRDNDLSSFGVTSAGQDTGVLNSTPKTIRSLRTAMSWNVLDFGLGYVRAKQQGERILIAQEEAHKQEQTLAQDVLVAYWDAYNAQQLIDETKLFRKLLLDAKTQLQHATHDKLIPQENILNFESALLQGDRRLSQLEYKYEKAMLDLRHLMNLPSDQELILLAPPAALNKTQSLKHLDLEKLDAVTLVIRPELRGQEYQKRIAELGVQTAILQALPGITLNDGWNYNSNKYLINNRWVDRSMDLAWNLLNLASLPSSYHAAKVQVKYETLKRMALTVAVLAETRYAYWHYSTLSDELAIAHRQTSNAEALYDLNHNRQLASLASNQQVILSRLNAITAKMDEQLLMSDLSTALGELYLSSGSDILPLDVEDETIAELTEKIRKKFVLKETTDFATFIDTAYNNIFNKPIKNTRDKLHQVHLPQTMTKPPIFSTNPAPKRLSPAISSLPSHPIKKAQRMASTQIAKANNKKISQIKLFNTTQKNVVTKLNSKSVASIAKKPNPMKKILTANKKPASKHKILTHNDVISSGKIVQANRVLRQTHIKHSSVVKLAKTQSTPYRTKKLLVKHTPNKLPIKQTMIATTTALHHSSAPKHSLVVTTNKVSPKSKQSPNKVKDSPTVAIRKQKELTSPIDKPHTKILVSSKPHYTVQVVGTYKLDQLRDYIALNPHHYDYHIGKTKFNNRNWYILTVGNYSSTALARKNQQMIAKKSLRRDIWIRQTDTLIWFT